MILRHFVRELNHHKGFAVFFLINLALGLFGFVALTAFRDSLEESLQSRSRAVLGADLAVSGRRDLTETDRDLLRSVLGDQKPESSTRELYSMMGSDVKGGPSRLVELMAVDRGFPLYGAITLQDGRRYTGLDPKPILDEKAVWIAPELAAQLNLNVGGIVYIGSYQYRVDGLIAEDATSSSRGFPLAPRVILALDQIDSQLINAKGSTVTFKYLFRLSDQVDADEISSQINRQLKEPGIRAISHRRASEQVGRALDYLTDYLGLVALVALFLAAVGAGFLYRSYMAGRLHDLAVLMSLGLIPTRARRLFMVQLGLLGALAALLGMALAAVLLPVIGSLVSGLVVIPISLNLGWKSIVTALLVSVIGSVLTCLPMLARIRGLKPAILFQEDQRPTLNMKTIRGRQLVAILPALLCFWGLAIWQSQSWLVGSLFVGLFMVSGVVVFALGVFFLKVLSVSGKNASLIPRLAIRNVARSRVASLSCFLAIALGTMMVNLIPQLQRGIALEIDRPDKSALPSIFLFDIQDEQVDPLKSSLSSMGTSLSSLSPMIRAQLVNLNGTEYRRPQNDESSFRTREDEREGVSRNRMYNLTFRSTLSEAETIVSGRTFVANYDPASKTLGEITLEERFAERMGMNLNDILTFDVQGVTIEGRVVGLRKVRWASFEPNFFVVFQPGVLEEAPKIWLASIRGLDQKAKATIQNQLVGLFPNISLIDVGALASRILSIFGQMSWALEFMAYLALFAGFVVLVSIARHQAHERAAETALYKVLGGSFSDIRAMIRLEFAGLAAMAGVCGALLALFCSGILAWFVFDGNWSPGWVVPVVSVIGVTMLAVVVSDLAVIKILKQKPLPILQRGFQPF